MFQVGICGIYGGVTSMSAHFFWHPWLQLGEKM